MSYQHVQRLAAVRAEFEAARLAISHLEQSWHQYAVRERRGSVGFPHVREAGRNLEITYVIRLFSEFEGLLYRHMAARYPGLRIPRTTEALINRVALRERIPDSIRDAAQAVREYRNSIVHQTGAPTAELTLQNATAEFHLAAPLSGRRFIILDEWIGGRSDFELHTLLKAAAEAREMAFGLFLGAPAADNTVFAAWAAGFDLLLTKPVDPAEFERYSRRLLNPPENEGRVIPPPE